MKTGGESIRVSKEVSKYMAKIGSRGGKIGGKRSLETMTPEERTDRAYRAALVRWGKPRRKKR